jgi:hypothetical protein
LSEKIPLPPTKADKRPFIASLLYMIHLSQSADRYLQKALITDK